MPDGVAPALGVFVRNLIIGWVEAGRRCCFGCQGVLSLPQSAHAYQFAFPIMNMRDVPFGERHAPPTDNWLFRPLLSN